MRWGWGVFGGVGLVGGMEGWDDVGLGSSTQEVGGRRHNDEKNNIR